MSPFQVEKFALAVHPTLVKLLLESPPAWVWSVRQENFVWSNPAGLALWKVKSREDLFDLVVESDMPGIQRLVDIPDELRQGTVRLERLRLFVGRQDINLVCQVSWLENTAEQLILVSALGQPNRAARKLNDKDAARVLLDMLHGRSLVASTEGEILATRDTQDLLGKDVSVGSWLLDFIDVRDWQTLVSEAKTDRTIEAKVLLPASGDRLPMLVRQVDARRSRFLVFSFGEPQFNSEEIHKPEENSKVSEDDKSSENDEQSPDTSSESSVATIGAAAAGVAAAGGVLAGLADTDDSDDTEENLQVSENNEAEDGKDSTTETSEFTDESVEEIASDLDVSADSGSESAEEPGIDEDQVSSEGLKAEIDDIGEDLERVADEIEEDASTLDDQVDEILGTETSTKEEDDLSEADHEVSAVDLAKHDSVSTEDQPEEETDSDEVGDSDEIIAPESDPSLYKLSDELTEREELLEDTDTTEVIETAKVEDDGAENSGVEVSNVVDLPIRSNRYLQDDVTDDSSSSDATFSSLTADVGGELLSENLTEESDIAVDYELSDPNIVDEVLDVETSENEGLVDEENLEAPLEVASENTDDSLADEIAGSENNEVDLISEKVEEEVENSISETLEEADDEIDLSKGAAVASHFLGSANIEDEDTSIDRDLQHHQDKEADQAIDSSSETDEDLDLLKADKISDAAELIESEEEHSFVEAEENGSADPAEEVELSESDLSEESLSKDGGTEVEEDAVPDSEGKVEDSEASRLAIFSKDAEPVDNDTDSQSIEIADSDDGADEAISEFSRKTENSDQETVSTEETEDKSTISKVAKNTGLAAAAAMLWQGFRGKNKAKPDAGETTSADTLKAENEAVEIEEQQDVLIVEERPDSKQTVEEEIQAFAEAKLSEEDKAQEVESKQDELTSGNSDTKIDADEIVAEIDETDSTITKTDEVLEDQIAEIVEEDAEQLEDSVEEAIAAATDEVVDEKDQLISDFKSELDEADIDDPIGEESLSDRNKYLGNENDGEEFAIDPHDTDELLIEANKDNEFIEIVDEVSEFQQELSSDEDDEDSRDGFVVSDGIEETDLASANLLSAQSDNQEPLDQTEDVSLLKRVAEEATSSEESEAQVEKDSFKALADALGVRLSTSSRDVDVNRFNGEISRASNRYILDDELPADVFASENLVSEVNTQSGQTVPANDELSDILRKVSGAIIVFSGDTPLFASQEFLDLFGYDDTDHLRESGGLTTILSSIDGPSSVPEENESAADQLIAHRRSGREIPINAKIQSVKWSGKQALLLKVQKRGADASKTTEKAGLTDIDFQNLINAQSDGSLVFDRHGLVLFANTRCCEIFGLSEEELSKRTVFELINQGAASIIGEFVQDDMTSSGSQDPIRNMDVIGRFGGSAEVRMKMSVHRISGSDKARFCGVFNDTSGWAKDKERFESELRSALQISKRKSDLLTKVSHEMRTPLNSILGFSEIMLNEQHGPIENKIYKEYTSDIHSSGEHLLSLVNDLLDLSKIESGNLQLNFTQIDLNDVVGESIRLMREQANKARIIIRSSLARQPIKVIADLRSLKQICLNLISNSIKFTNPGGQVIVSTYLDDTGDVHVRVRDTGVGMNKKDLKEALEPFKQLYSTSFDVSEGSGLGLSLTKALVEANRATFDLQSSKEEGTLAELTFPANRVV